MSTEAIIFFSSRRRHTRWPRDWSSDVCSSDLHCFNEKENKHIFSDRLNINQKLFEAIERGVYLDIGHGTSSFSYHIAKKAKTENISFHSISTDIYEKNQFNGPVYAMATTLSKFIGLAYSLEKVIHSVTTCPDWMTFSNE